MYKVTYPQSHNTTQIINLYRVIFDCINMIKTIKCTKSQCTKSHIQSHIVPHKSQIRLERYLNALTRLKNYNMYKVTIYKAIYPESHNTTKITNLYR